jgi:DNA-binding XRE family transcriptional regulator
MNPSERAQAIATLSGQLAEIEGYLAQLRADCGHEVTRPADAVEKDRGVCVVCEICHQEFTTPDPSLVEFPERLRSMRRAARLSQSRLARLAGLDKGEISHYECGRRKPSMDHVMRLADALKVTADRFWPRRGGKI